MISIEELCDEHGLLLRRDANAAGIQDIVLTRAVRAGALHRLRHGLYVRRTVWDAASHEERHRLLSRAIIQLYDDDVVLSHASSAIWQGGPSWGVDLSMCHLTHRSGRGGRRHAKVVHHHGSCTDDDLEVLAGVTVTTPPRLVVEVLSTDGTEAALVQANHFLHEQRMTQDELADRIRALRNWPGTLSGETVIRLSDPAIETVAETRVSLLCFRARLPLPQAQVDILDADGEFIGRVDFAWLEERVIVEFDGLVKYRQPHPGSSAAEVLIAEKRREERLREAGWTVIRLTWADLQRPEQTANRIRVALARARAAKPAS